MRVAMPLGILISVLGLLLNPCWHRLNPQAGLAPYWVGLGLVALGDAILFLGLALRLRRRNRQAILGQLRLALALISLLTFFLATELGATAYLHWTGQGERLREFRQVQLHETPARFVAHPFLLYTKNPKIPGVNSLGFFGPEWSVQKKPGTLRIACLGGSTTEDGYPYWVEETLRRKHPGRPIEVMNFGTNGWTTANTLINYCLNVRHFKPDIVILHEGANEFKMTWYGTPRTDYQHAYQVLTMPSLPLDDGLLRYLNGYALLKWKINELRKLPASPSLEDAVLRPNPILGGIPFEINGVAAIYQCNMEALVRLIREDGAKPLILTQPFSRTNLAWSDNFVKFMEKMNATARELALRDKVPLIDLDQQMLGQEQYHTDPIHFNQEGIMIKARAVADAIDSTKS